MTSYSLEIVIDAVDELMFTTICSHFHRSSFEYSYARSLVPPNKMYFTFGPLSETGVTNMKERWREFGLKNGQFTEREYDSKTKGYMR